MKGQTSESILQPKLQRRLRNNMTDAEQKLWSILRGVNSKGSSSAGNIPTTFTSSISSVSTGNLSWRRTADNMRNRMRTQSGIDSCNKTDSLSCGSGTTKYSKTSRELPK